MARKVYETIRRQSRQLLSRLVPLGMEVLLKWKGPFCVSLNIKQDLVHGSQVTLTIWMVPSSRKFVVYVD